MYRPKIWLAIIVVTLMSACMQTQNVRGKPVPTAFFVFFDQGSAEPTKESAAIFDEAAAFLKQYDNTTARVVGHISTEEASATLDQERASRVAEELVKRGAQAARLQLLGVGNTEKITGRNGNTDSSMDRRVEILFNAM